MRCGACNKIMSKPILVYYKDSKGDTHKVEEWLCKVCDDAAHDVTPDVVEDNIFDGWFDEVDDYE